jgi:glutaredoxin
MNLPAGADRRSSRAPIDRPATGSLTTFPAVRHLYDAAVVLYTCSLEKAAGGLPAPLAHPCGRAAKALDDAGHQYEIKQVKGGSLRFWTWPSRAKDRAEVERLSGQRGVPILVLDNGEVISGSGDIASWARTNEAVA